MPKRRIHWQAKTHDPKNPRDPCCLIATRQCVSAQRISGIAMGIIHSVAATRRAVSGSAEKWAQTTACRQNRGGVGASTQTGPDERPFARPVVPALVARRRCRFGEPHPAASLRSVAQRPAQHALAPPRSRAQGRGSCPVDRLAGRHRVASGTTTLARPAADDRRGLLLGRSLRRAGRRAPAGADDGGMHLVLARQSARQSGRGGRGDRVDGEPVQFHGRERRAGVGNGRDRTSGRTRLRRR